ncbi:membrane protein [Nonomuraea cavernae]|uniref:Membrane protein n=1 Tax=Nonomuraea cavernae TaxID=2045107 RepID=A0A917YVZ4_9ACTN|nr:membrane protein [Nonomuraea cavernae]
MPYREVFAVGVFRTLFVGQTLMVISEAMKMLALSLLVFARTGSPLMAAVAYMAGMLAYLVGGTLLLSLADRISTRPLLVTFHLVRFCVIGVLAFVVLPVPVVLILAAVIGLFGPVAEGNATALLADVLRDRSYITGRSLMTAAAAASQVIGHGISGLLLITMSAYGVLATASAFCLVAAVVTWFGLRDSPRRGADRPDRADRADRVDGVDHADRADRPASTPGASPLRRLLRTGAAASTWQVNRQLLADRHIRGLLLAILVPTSLAVGAEGAVVPYTADMGQAPAGLLLSAMAGGMLLSNVLIGRFAGVETAERLVLPLIYLTGGGLVAFALRPGLPVAVALAAASSAGLGYEIGLQRRFLQALPEHARGQAFGLVSTGLMSGQALGAVAVGALTGIAGAGLSIAVFGALVIAAGVLLRRHLLPGRKAGPASPQIDRVVAETRCARSLPLPSCPDESRTDVQDRSY